MHTFIIDQFTHQQLHKRFLWNIITGLGWAFWIYLWMPIIRAIAMLLRPHPEYTTSDASRSIQGLFATMTTHALTMVILIVAFLAWILLRWWGTGKHRHTLREQSLRWHHPELLAKSTGQEVNSWRHTQRMVVTHDDDSGLIQHIDILITELNHPLSGCE